MAEKVLLELEYGMPDKGEVFKIIIPSRCRYVLELVCPIKHTQFTLKDVDKIIDALLRFRLTYEK
jgi:hypothetical protein